MRPVLAILFGRHRHSTTTHLCAQEAAFYLTDVRANRKIHHDSPRRACIDFLDLEPYTADS